MKGVISFVALFAVVFSGTAFGACGGCNKCSSCGHKPKVVRLVAKKSVEPVPVVYQEPEPVIIEKPVFVPQPVLQDSVGNWYIGARAELSFLSWKNKYDTTQPDPVVKFDNDKYSFEPVMGADFDLGYRFNRVWRAELELGYTGVFSDSDDQFEFKLTVPYLMLNGYANVFEGLYLGLGVGVALPYTRIEGWFDTDSSDISVSPMLAAMIGYSFDITERFALDLRYRFAAMWGDEQKLYWYDTDDGANYEFSNKIGTIIDNSISFGVRYMF